MPLTIIDEATVTVDADIHGDSIAISPADFEAATGWVLEPEGLCRGSVCLPLRDEVTTGDGVDLAAAARVLGRSLVYEQAGPVAAFGDDAMARGERTNCDGVTLPGLDGAPIRFSDLAGKKRLLIAWASW